jgi:MFS family permease
LGARFLDRLGTGTRSAPRDALIASSADEEHRGKAFGLEGVGDNLGAFLGPLLAIFLLLFLHIDLRLIFYLAIIPGLLAVLMIMLVTERPVVVSAKSKLDMQVADASLERAEARSIAKLEPSARCLRQSKM